MKYLASYCGLVLLACAVFGVALFSITVSELNDVSLSETSKRIQAVADDLDRQYGIMQNIAYEVSANYLCKPAYVRQNKYHEVELLKDLSKYEGYSPLVGNFFLIYAGDDMVYQPIQLSKNKVSVFMNSMLGVTGAREAQETYARILALASPEALSLPKDSFLFCYPLRLNHPSEVEAFLCFHVSAARLSRRATEVGGSFSGELAVRFQGAPLIGEMRDAAPICAYESENGFEICLYAASAYSRIGAYKTTFWLVVGALLILFVAIAAMAAARSYRPVRELVAQFGGKLEDGVNEFASIQELVRKSVEANHISREKLMDNMKWLNGQRARNLEQFLLLALTGSLPASRMDAGEFDMLGDGRSFAVVCAKLARSADPDELRAQIAALGDGNTSFCAVRLPYEDIWAVVMSFTGEMDAGNTRALLSALFDAWGISAKISFGAVCAELERLSDSFAEALAGLEKSAEEGGVWYSENEINQLLSAIRAGSGAQTRELLEGMLARVDGDGASMLFRLCAMSDIINAMLRASAGAGVDVPAEKLSLILQYSQPAVVREKMLELADELCRGFGSRREQQDARLQRDIVGYIDGHLEHYELSLSYAAEQNGLSVRRLEQLVRQETGHTFKEYVIIRRMERAKKMLAEGAGVTDTGVTLCYNSISYFIKTFKQYTGMTPTEYRRSLGDPPRG